MPLCSYIASFNGGSYADQDSRSNFKGFAALALSRIPPNELPGLTLNLQRELVEKAARADWAEVSNRKHLWVMQFVLDGKPFTLHAVQTQA
jgi:hypothetical protein